MKTVIRLAVVTAAFTAALPAYAQDSDWLIAPYFWVPDISLVQGGGDGGGVSGSDLLDKTDAAGMIRIEGAQGRWGGTLDYIFLGLSENQSFGLPGEIGINVNSNLDLTVLELGGFYRFSGAEDGLHLLFGYRGIGSDTSVIITRPNVVPERRDDSASLNDVFLGARYTFRVTDRIDLTARGDYSFGDTEGVVNGIASAGFRFTDWFALNLGYRYANLEYKTNSDGDTVTTEIELSGPFLGFLFRFQ